MLPLGLVVTLDLAVGPAGSRTPRRRERYAAMILGMFREDVLCLPVLDRVSISPSLRHHYPHSRRYCARFVDEALTEARGGRDVQGAFLLGRALHVLIDMACPVHAQAALHYLDDPFERHVDAHIAALGRLAVPPLPAGVREGSIEGVVDSLAGAARREKADRTRTPWGRVLRRLGRRTPVTGAQVAAQARRLIPLAAAHARVLTSRFDRAAGAAVGV